MGVKSLIYLCLFVGSIIGGWIGSVFDHGNIFGMWNFGLGTLGALFGIWVGYKLGQ